MDWNNDCPYLNDETGMCEIMGDYCEEYYDCPFKDKE